MLFAGLQNVPTGLTGFFVIGPVAPVADSGAAGGSWDLNGILLTTEDSMKVVALDPGTHVTGYAVFQDVSPTGRAHAMALHSFGSIKPPWNAEFEDRIKFILEAVNQLLPVDVVVCEAQPTMRGRVSPELAVLIRRFRRWASQTLKVRWEPINTQTVTAAMRREIGNPAPGIKRMPPLTRALAIQKIYGIAPDGVAQDVIDAVAVGWTFLEKGHL